MTEISNEYKWVAQLAHFGGLKVVFFHSILSWNHISFLSVIKEPYCNFNLIISLSVDHFCHWSSVILVCFMLSTVSVFYAIYCMVQFEEQF